MDIGSISGKVDLDIAAFEKKYETVNAALDKLESSKSTEVAVTADTTRALSDLTGVESLLTGVLDGMRAEVAVSADASRAEGAIKTVEGLLNSLEGERATLEVDADTSAAEAAFNDVSDAAAGAGRDGGEGMAAGILAGLASIPLAGAVVKIGQSIAQGLVDAVRDGLGQEVSRDLFSAKTGLDAATAAKFAAAAGAAYGQAWGDSVEANLDAARDALQKGLIDPDASSASIEQFMAQIQAMSTLAEEEAAAISTALDSMVSSGLSADIGSAMDALTVGLQQGVNSADDLFDTFTEYSGLFSALGLDASEAMGLLNQGLEGGARSADLVADALKEFQIRATDASTSSAEAFESLGMNAADMTAQIAAGGESAKAGLEAVLTALADMEDPVARNAAGVGLFGTQWEDMAGAMASLDVSTAVSGLGEVEGALESAMSTMSDNPAAQIEEAMRNIELAMDGVKGALAAAFSEPLADLAAWATGNSAGVMEAIQGWGNGLFDLAAAGVDAAATMTEAFGGFISSTGLAFAEMLQGFLTGTAGNVMENALGIDRDQALADLNAISTDLIGLSLSSQQTADDIRSSLIDGGIRPVQDAFNEEIEVQIDLAQVRDDAGAVADAISDLGGQMESIGGIELDLGGTFSTATAEGAALHDQMLSVVDSMAQVQSSAAGAGESQGALVERFEMGREAVLGQLEALGLTRDAAAAVAEAYGLVPEMIETSLVLDSAPAMMSIGDLQIAIDQASGTITVNGDVTPASTTLGELLGNVNAATGTVDINGNSVPANMTLEQFIGIVSGSQGTVTIDGNTYDGARALSSLIGAINTSNGYVKVNADTSNAYASVDAMMRHYNGRVMTVYTMIKTIGQAPVATGGDVDAHARAAMGFAAGGAVLGAGTGTSDDIPAGHPSGVQFWLSNGEHVLTADDVLDLGGQQGAYMLRAMIQAGMVKPLESGTRLASGGPVGRSADGSSAVLPSLPSHVTLVDESGALLGRMRVVAQEQAGRALTTAVRRSR